MLTPKDLYARQSELPTNQSKILIFYSAQIFLSNIPIS